MFSFARLASLARPFRVAPLPDWNTPSPRCVRHGGVWPPAVVLHPPPSEHRPVLSGRARRVVLLAEGKGRDDCPNRTEMGIYLTRIYTCYPVEEAPYCLFGTDLASRARWLPALVSVVRLPSEFGHDERPPAGCMRRNASQPASAYDRSRSHRPFILHAGLVWISRRELGCCARPRHETSVVYLPFFLLLH